MSTMIHNNIVDVNTADFQTQVIQRSHQVPVVVDFWAPWCGPCRMLGPILERLAAEPNSGFVLAKVNSDHNQQLSMQYGVRGIPAVKAFANGRVVDEFVGAQPEPRVRQFVQKLTAGFRQLSQPKASSRTPSKDLATRLDQARQYLRQGKGCQALTQLKDFPAGSQQATSARKLLPVAQFMCQMSRGESNGASAELGALHGQTADALQRREYSAAMYNLLAILNREKGNPTGRARQVMLGLFELLGENDPLTQAYRQQLSV